MVGAMTPATMTPRSRDVDFVNVVLFDDNFGVDKTHFRGVVGGQRYVNGKEKFKDKGQRVAKAADRGSSELTSRKLEP